MAIKWAFSLLQKENFMLSHENVKKCHSCQSHASCVVQKLPLTAFFLLYISGFFWEASLGSNWCSNSFFCINFISVMWVTSTQYLPLSVCAFHTHTPQLTPLHALFEVREEARGGFHHHGKVEIHVIGEGLFYGDRMFGQYLGENCIIF